MGLAMRSIFQKISFLSFQILFHYKKKKMKAIKFCPTTHIIVPDRLFHPANFEQ